MNNRKTPRIRFRGFTDDWEQRKLGEISPLRGGFAFKSEEYADEGIPIIRISNILSDGTVGSEFAYCKEQTDDVAFTLKNGAALLAMSGATTGKVSVLHARNTDKYYQNQRVGYFTQIRDYDYGFVSTIVRSQMFLDQLSAVLVAGAQPNVSSKDIDGFEFMIPMSKVEQEKLGEIFFSLDHLITLHQRKLEKLKIVKKAMLENCFPKNGEKVPRFRFSGFTGDWEQRKLGEISPLRGGFAFKSEEYADEGIPIIRISNILSDGTVGSEFAYCKEQTDDVAFTLKNGAALLAMSGATTGKVSVLHARNTDKYYQNQRVGYFTQIRDYDYGFVSTIVRSQMFLDQLSAVLVAGAQPNVSSKDIDGFEFMIPMSKVEQEKLGEIFFSLDHLITLHQRKLEKLKIIKKSFLEKMFV